VVVELARHIQKNEQDLRGFSDKNLWRMKQFYESYKDYPKLSPLEREISWTNNMLIFSRCKTPEEKEFYLNLTAKEHYSKRELDRQISASLFEMAMIGNTNPVQVKFNQNHGLTNDFKDSYVFEFLNLPEPYNESDLYRK